MTQEAVVTAVYDNGMAEVCVTRQTACGGNCGSCETCLLSHEIKVDAVNEINAAVGQRVLIHSESKPVYKAMWLVYIMPVLLFVAGYFLGFAFGLPEGMCAAISFMTLIVSAAILYFTAGNKKSNEQFTYAVCKILEGK